VALPAASSSVRAKLTQLLRTVVITIVVAISQFAAAISFRFISARSFIVRTVLIVFADTDKAVSANISPFSHSGQA